MELSTPRKGKWKLKWKSLNRNFIVPQNKVFANVKRELFAELLQSTDSNSGLYILTWGNTDVFFEGFGKIVYRGISKGEGDV